MANTIKFGNGQWATKEDSILAYNDENANFKPLPFVTSRATTATRVNKAGLLETVASGVPRVDYLDNSKGSYLLEPTSRNLITQSEAFGNSYWTKSNASIEGDASTAGSEEVVNGDFATDTDWAKGGSTISGGSAHIVGDGSSYVYVSQANVFEDNKTYLCVFDVVITSGLGLKFQDGSSNENIGYATTTGSYSFYFTGTSNSTIVIGRRAGGTSFDSSVSNISVKEVQGFASPSVDSPLGAFKLVGSTTNGQHRIDATSSSIIGSTAFSIIAKKGEYDNLWMRTGTSGAFFDLENGISGGDSAGIVSSIESYGNGFYRCTIVKSSSAANEVCRINLLATYADASDFTGDGTSGVYIFGAQLEAQSYATSYIPTAGTVISRTADSASKTGISSLINSSEGVFYAEIENKFPSATTRGWNLQSSLNNGSDLIAIRFSNAQSIVFYLRANGVTTINQSVVNSYNGFIKIALKYKSGDSSLWINGVEVSLSSTAFSFGNPLSILGNNDGLGGVGSFGLKDSRVYKTILSDAELQTLTTI